VGSWMGQAGGGHATQPSMDPAIQRVIIFINYKTNAPSADSWNRVWAPVARAHGTIARHDTRAQRGRGSELCALKQ
jgi:hypothetical protein